VKLASALILADTRKSSVSELLPEVRAYLAERLPGGVADEDVRTFYQRRRDHRDRPLDPRPDLLVVLGGDGTMLSAAAAAGAPIPTIGINFGRVGFLAPHEAHDWRKGLDEVLAGQARFEPRMRLRTRLFVEGGRKERLEVTALNDLAFSRGAVQGMVGVSLEVGGEWVSDYRADGLIVATPSGSTAYSLAAGGPLLAPSMDGIVVTPICPHALSHRPLVLAPDSEIALRVTQASGLVTMSVDGREFHPLEEGDVALVERHPEPWPLLAPAEQSPWLRLRERLGWRGSFRSPEETEEERPLHEGTREEGLGEVL